MYLHNPRNPEETTKATIFIVVLTYSDYFYAKGMTECDIRNWVRVNNNAWTEHNNTVLTSAKVKSLRWKPVVEGHVKLITIHILAGMEDMTFDSLDEIHFT